MDVFQLFENIYAVCVRHADVQQDDIEIPGLYHADGFDAAFCLTRDTQVVGVIQQLLQPFADQGVVVGDEHFNHVLFPSTYSFKQGLLEF